MAAEYRGQTNLIKPQGFYFQWQHKFSSRKVADHVVAALIGEHLSEVSVADARARAVGKLEALFNSCLSKELLFRAVRDSDLFWESIANDFEGYSVLSPPELRETVSTYAEARRMHRGKFGPTRLNSLVDQWNQFVQETSYLDLPSSLNLAWRPGASGVFVELAQSMGSVSLDHSLTKTLETWPPVHFNEEEIMLLTTAEFRQELYAITSSNHGPSDMIPRDLTKAVDVRKFLCWIALISTTSESKKVLYPTPVAFIDR